MKKTTKKTTIVMLLFVVVIAFSLFLLLPKTYRVVTEYGDIFSVGDSVGMYNILHDNEYIANVTSPKWKREFIPICDSEYFRCYKIKTDQDELYIFKIKELESFYTIYCNENEEETEYMQQVIKGHDGKVIKDHFLCDEHLMEITGPFLLDSYYDEMRTVVDDLNNGNYGKLKEYGLTDEMIKDTESLEKKKALMNQLVEGHKIKY